MALDKKDRKKERRRKKKENTLRENVRRVMETITSQVFPFVPLSTHLFPVCRFAFAAS